MSGDIQSEICLGIDRSEIILVFITQTYIQKVAALKGSQDFCRFEFNYTVQRKGPFLMQAVVMENRCRDVSKWEGPVGGNLGFALYFDFVDDNNFDEKIDRLAELIRKRIPILQPHVDTCATVETNAIIPSKRKQNGEDSGRKILLNPSLPIVVNYSERAIAVFGDSKALRDRFKAIGGKFNKSLKWEGGTRAGWVFPATQSQEVRLAVESSKERKEVEKDSCDDQVMVSVEPIEKVESMV